MSGNAEVRPVTPASKGWLASMERRSFGNSSFPATWAEQVTMSEFRFKMPTHLSRAFVDQLPHIQDFLAEKLPRFSPQQLAEIMAAFAELCALDNNGDTSLKADPTKGRQFFNNQAAKDQWLKVATLFKKMAWEAKPPVLTTTINEVTHYLHRTTLPMIAQTYSEYRFGVDTSLAGAINEDLHHIVKLMKEISPKLSSQQLTHLLNLYVAVCQANNEFKGDVPPNKSGFYTATAMKMWAVFTEEALQIAREADPTTQADSLLNTFGELRNTFLTRIRMSYLINESSQQSLRLVQRDDETVTIAAVSAST